MRTCYHTSNDAIAILRIPNANERSSTFGQAFGAEASYRSGGMK